MSESSSEAEHNHPPESATPKAEASGQRLRLRLENQLVSCLADLEPIEQATPATAPADETVALTPDTEFPVTAEFLPPERLTPVSLLNLLKTHGITLTIDFEALYLLCAAAAEGLSRQGVLLAAGRQPVAGAEGWFEMAVKAPGEDAEFAEDARGNVDLRTLHRHSEIKLGQKLGTVHPPKAGVSGVTANGLPIPAAQGKSFDLIAGEGVLLKYEGRVAFAEKTGRALLNKQTLAVVDQLAIGGDLDLNTGNIDFHGFVEIKGDVPDDFSIKASKGLRITGAVGACQIEAHGPVEIGSMAGKEVGQILCHGDLKAGYLNQTRVFCHGDILVSNEIRNSLVKSTGQIIVERGSIIGGTAVALEGIEAKVLGASSCVRTQLVAGVYFPDTDRFDYLHQRLTQLNGQLQSIHDALGPLKRKELQKALANASERRQSILNEQWEKLEQEKEQVCAELRSSQPQVFSSSNPKINALTSINEGVVACLGQTCEKITRVIAGPITLIENTREGGLRHLSLSPLINSAALLEEEILQEELPPEEREPADSTKN